ncbi:type I restriction enzyme endonuclease domain-containing protein [Streptomyces sp. NPDC017943]|uniref:type I restriction enzyme endonuclease domain-containing protein n=1 Tax=Streptomyces sp. NPDC017943 TaxID=3365019 RepID=UPI0037BC5052
MADLTHLNEALVAKLQGSDTPHLAAEALRRLIERKMREVTRDDIVRRTAFSDRLQDLMIRNTRQQYTSAGLIAKLVEIANEVVEDGRRGEKVRSTAELARARLLRRRARARHCSGTHGDLVIASQKFRG